MFCEDIKSHNSHHLDLIPYDPIYKHKLDFFAIMLHAEYQQTSLKLLMKADFLDKTNKKSTNKKYMSQIIHKYLHILEMSRLFFKYCNVYKVYPIQLNPILQEAFSRWSGCTCLMVSLMTRPVWSPTSWLPWRHQAWRRRAYSSSSSTPAQPTTLSSSSTWGTRQHGNYLEGYCIGAVSRVCTIQPYFIWN